MASVLDPLLQIHPGRFIQQFSDWVIFTLLLVFFISVAGITLQKRFPNNRYAKALIISVGLMLSVGVYFSIYKGWLHLSLQGFGLIGAILVFIVIFFVVYGLIRGFGMHASTALPLGYGLLYISLWAVSPNIFDTFADRLPIINLILLILFVASLFKLVSGFFRHSKSPMGAIKELKTVNPETIETPQQAEQQEEVEKETTEEKKEQKQIKKKTMRITKKEVHTIEDMKNILDQMIATVRQKGNSVDEEEVGQLTHNLRQIYAKEALLKKGMFLIQRHVKAYNTLHKKNIQELQKRLNQTDDKTQKKTIDEELLYQKRMLQAIDFLQKNESRITEFVQRFNRSIYTAITKVKTKYPYDAMAYLQQANMGLNQMQKTYDRIQHFERYLLKLNKKTISDLKKERK